MSLDSNYADNIPYEDNLSSYNAGVMFFLSSKIFSPFCVGIFLSFNTPDTFRDKIFSVILMIVYKDV